jgi:dienelactone hydrolase
MHGITAYIAKPPSESQSNGIGILSFQDIHPFDSARHFQVADTFAQLGYTVVHMDITGANFFANTDFSRIFEWVRSYPYDDGEKLNLTVEAAMRFLKNPKHNITKIAAIGFCWGSLMIFQACAAGAKIEAAVCYHPSLRLNQGKWMLISKKEKKN